MPVLLTTNKKSYFVQLCVEGKRYYLGAYGSRFKAEVIEREGLTAYEQGGQEALTEFQNTLNYKRVGVSSGAGSPSLHLRIGQALRRLC